MEAIQITIEPQTICPCGKSYIPMTAQERIAYDEAVRRIEEARRSAEDEKHSAGTADRN